MNAGFPLHAVACGQPRKCVLQSPNTNVEVGTCPAKRARVGRRPLAFSYRRACLE
jgi:hypothetical protein